jgi:hypothetical protein
MSWTLLLALAHAQDGTAIGIVGPLPEEPASVQPTHSRSIGLDMARAAHPEVLVPVGYNSSRGNFWERYYDESGQVWRYREVEAILALEAGSAQYIDQAKRKRRVGYTIGIVGLICFPDTLGCCVSEGGMDYAYYASTASFRSALTSYNLRNQMPAAAPADVPAAPPAEEFAEEPIEEPAEEPEQAEPSPSEP